MASYIEKRANRYYVTLHIPESLREKFGRMKFFQSLKTESKTEAETRARPLIARWKAELRQAEGEPDAVMQEARRWAEFMRQLPPDAENRDVMEWLITDRAEALEESGTAPDATTLFVGVAFGEKTLTLPLYEQWSLALESSGLGQKNIDQQRKDVSGMVRHFATLEEISAKAVKDWMRELTDGGTTLSSRRRILYSCRGFWKRVVHDELASAEARPFNVPPSPHGYGPKKARKSDQRAPFESAEVVSLWQQAKTNGDSKLADLIALGAYTGARIEELCSMKTSDVRGHGLRIEEAKTDAGWREVPIHAAIAALVERLKKGSDDGYLLSGLTFNKYDDRSNAIGKRFGRMKTTMGFPATKVFHSIRKTVTTQLENAGVPVGTAADILGHEKTDFTYRVYSGGTTLDVKAEALAKVSYPFPDGGQPT